MNLAAASVLYRRPDWYDDLNTPDTTTITTLISEQRTHPARSILDLGCGTGKLLAELPPAYTRRVGVDVQPAMVGHAQRVRPQLDVRVADVRHVRLGETCDAITCVGFTLAYLHADDDLECAVASITAHTHPGSVVVIQTLTEPVIHAFPVEKTMMVGGRPAEVTTRYEWRRPFVLMFRRWAFADGGTAEDMLPRRVWPVSHLHASFRGKGLHLVEARSGYLTFAWSAKGGQGG